MKIYTNFFKYLLLFAILATVFACGKDDEDMSGGASSKKCTLTSIFNKGVLTTTYEIIDENFYRRNSYDSTGVKTGYYLYEKDGGGNLVKKSYFNRFEELLGYTTYTYTQGGDLPDLIEIFNDENGTFVQTWKYVYTYNEGDCKRDRIEYFDRNQIRVAYATFAYQDANCSYIYRQVAIAPDGEEIVGRELEYTNDSFNGPFGQFKLSYLTDHNITQCYDILNDTNFATGIYEYNEYGYPISETATYTYIDGTVIIDNLVYEYECE